MHRSLLGRESLPRIPPQQALDEVLRQVALAGPGLGGEFEVTPFDGFENVLIGLTVERGVPAQQDVSDDADGPYIAGLVVPALEQLRGHVVRGPHGVAHRRLVPIVPPR